MLVAEPGWPRPSETAEPTRSVTTWPGGALCGRAGTSDNVDAVVIEAAGRRGDEVYQ